MKLTSLNSTGPFAFILELDKLTTETSPNQIGKHYVVKGDPTNSLIHQRYSPGGGMPPAGVVQRPTTADTGVLDAWIATCIGDADSPGGWAPFVTTDAGPTTDGVLPACGPANVCPDGGCCVFSQCVPNGVACGPLKNPMPGMQDLLGLPGTCSMGSCQKDGASCGRVDEPCCAYDLCTASQSSCLITDVTKCSACGGTDEPCCKPNSCLDGRTCINGGVNHVGTCKDCGALGQPCCGTGVAAAQKCNVASLVCVNDTTVGAVCQTCGDAGQPCCHVSGQDMCNGSLSCAPDAGGMGKVCSADAGTAAAGSGGV